MNKTLSPAAVVALKDALANIYWFRKDLRTFLSSCMQNNHLLSKYDWQNETKKDIASDLIDCMLSSNGTYIADFTTICYEVSNIRDFTHLQHLDDAQVKIQKAQAAVAQLKKLVEPHKDKQIEAEQIKARRKIADDIRKRNLSSQQMLEEIKEDYIALLTSNDHQIRGFKLEKILNSLFELYELDPRASFRIVGEQVDGAFSLNHTEYLFEAKWQKPLSDQADLLIFAGKVEGKLENTLGLFLSISGFSPTGIDAFTRGKKSSILLMDGEDLMSVLEERIKIVDLLHRKKQHAAQTGNIYFTYRKMIASN